MDIIELLKSEYISAIFGGVGGVITAWLTHRLVSRRGIFSYFVNHNRVGITTQDSVFGNVAVTWNNEPAKHLFFSTIELKNDSLNDYENVVINAYTSNTLLLTESTQIVDSPTTLHPTERYLEKIKVNAGQTPTDTQRITFHGQREYIIPVFNRGQKVKIQYLNSASSDEVPSIWLSALIKGVRLKFQVPRPHILGIPRSSAAIVGAIIGLIGLIPLVSLVTNPWLLAMATLVYGYLVVIPGAYFLISIRKVRELIGG
jgi:hypothetical protein